MSQSRRNPVAWRLFAVLLALAPAGLDAQQVVSLVSFTNAWRYNDSGADLGANWSTPAFNDGDWGVGQPLFGVETDVPFPYANAGFPAIATPLLLTAPGNGSQTITYYFRTRFNLPFPSTNVVGLKVTSYVDDGCVIYLNGAEAGRIRVPAGQNFLTLASGSPTVEGLAEVITLSPAGLLPGENVLAVEVHQSAPGSSDVVLGLSLDGQQAESLAITNQPRSTTIVVDRPVVFNVGVRGSLVTYQWRRNQTAIPGATRASYTNVNVQLADAGDYSVVVSNAFGTVVSDDALLTVLPDIRGPRMLSATVREEATRTNRIVITWDEWLTNTSVCIACRTNFSVTLMPSNIPVTISNLLYNPTGGEGGQPVTILLMSTTNWHIGSNYYVSVRNIRDRIGNVTPPDSRIPVSWPVHTNLFGFGQLWSFHVGSLFEPEIFEQAWYATNYVESGPWWGLGVGPFCGGQVRTCSFDFNSCETTIGFQPTLFRTTFVAPTNPGSLPPQLRFSHVVDDAAVFYLNGTELFRHNLHAPPTPLTSQTKALNSVGIAGCVTTSISVTNLLPGTNWLAAAVFQSVDPNDADAAFHLVLGHTGFYPGPLPEVPVPRLNIAAEGTNQFRLWWDGPGYALESTTSLALTGSGATGAWLEVTNISNPFIDVLTGERRFFRLRQ